VESGAERHNLNGSDKEIVALAFSPDGKVLAGGSEDGMFRLWDSANGKLAGEIKGPMQEGKSWRGNLVFAPDGKTLAAAGWERAVRLGRGDRKELRPVGDHPVRVYRVAFSRPAVLDGRAAATPSICGTWRPRGVRPRGGHEDRVRASRLDPGRSKPAYGRSRRYDPGGNLPPARKSACLRSRQRRGHRAGRQMLAAVGDDGTVRIRTWFRARNVGGCPSRVG
jgi:hypothetical protein